MLIRTGKISFFPTASSPLSRVFSALQREKANTSRCGAVQGAPGKCDHPLSVLQSAAWLRTADKDLPRVRHGEGTPIVLGSTDQWSSNDVLMSGCEVGGPRLRVAVLLSGGVDSSVALALLKAAGHDVRAFYLQIWFQEDFRNFWDACPWEEDIGFAEKVCARLGVPLEVVPLSKEYWSRVVVRSISQIKRGYTPNPDVLCNSEVKFGAFYDFLEKHSDSFDRIASGHYAGLVRDANQQLVKLAVTTDAIKDQTYFLARLEQQQLAKAMFPLGRLDKSIVRELARIAGLPTQFRKDSQGICFLGKVKFNEFVKEHLGEWPGPLLEEETGQHLGLHKGYWFHTIGQRTGLGLAGGPWYVVRKDIDWNVVFISQNYSALEENRGSFRCTSVNWISGPPEPDKQLYCKVRHGPHSYACELVVDERGHGTVTIHGRDQGLAVGQYAVFYQDMICLGCAVIDWV